MVEYAASLQTTCWRVHFGILFSPATPAPHCKQREGRAFLCAVQGLFFMELQNNIINWNLPPAVWSGVVHSTSWGLFHLILLKGYEDRGCFLRTDLSVAFIATANAEGYVLEMELPQMLLPQVLCRDWTLAWSLQLPWQHCLLFPMHCLWHYSGFVKMWNR